MTAFVPAAGTGLRRRVAVGLAWRPDWPVAVLVAAAWVALAALHLLGSGPDGACAGGHLGHAGHPGHLDPGAPGGAGAAAAAAVGGWTLMAAAMMTPATLPAARYVGLTSIRPRRRRAVALYVAAYLGVWVAFGVAALGLVAGARSAGVDDRPFAAATVAVAAAWQLTRTKRRAVLACGRTVPLPPEGRRADLACLRFGLRQAARCAVSCWPLMAVMAVVGHSGPAALAAMVALTAVVVAEERPAWARRLAGPVAGALALAAAGLAVAP